MLMMRRWRSAHLSYVKRFHQMFEYTSWLCFVAKPKTERLGQLGEQLVDFPFHENLAHLNIAVHIGHVMCL